MKSVHRFVALLAGALLAFTPPLQALAEDYIDALALIGAGRGAVDIARLFPHHVTTDTLETIAYENLGAWAEPQDLVRYRAVMVFSLLNQPPVRPWTPEDVALLQDWVAGGGTLVFLGGIYTLAGNQRNLDVLAPLLGANRYANLGDLKVVEPRHPLLRDAAEDPAALEIRVSHGLGGLNTSRALIADSGGNALLAVNSIGKGQVIVLHAQLSRLNDDSFAAYAAIVRNIIDGMGLEIKALTSREWGLEPLGPRGPSAASPAAPSGISVKRPGRDHHAGLQVRAVDGEAFILASAEQPAVIVLAENPSPAARAAANLLSRTLESMTGKPIPAVSEQQIEFIAAKDGMKMPMLDGKPVSVVMVGDTEAGRSAGIRPDTLPEEGYLLRTGGRHVLYVAGRDLSANGLSTRGTRYAAVALLERHLGCRWLWPGELGEVIPSMEHITIGPLDEQDAPALAVRTVRAGIHRQSRRAMIGARRMGMDEAALRARSLPFQDWYARQSLGGHMRLRYGHAYNGWWEAYGEDHPDWFALQPDGSRAQNPPREQMCFSNHALAEEVARVRIDELGKDPTLQSVSLSPNDGSGHNFVCMGIECRELDPVDAPPIHMLFQIAGIRHYLPYVSLSDRMVTFYNRVAEHVAAVHPQRWVAGYAYGAYRDAPVHAQVHPNVLIAFVGFVYLNDHRRARDLENWDRWTRSARQMFLRPNALLGAYGFPVNFVPQMAGDLEHAWQSGLVGADYSAISGHWASQGLNYYVLPRLLWNPAADVDAIIRDYCEKGFGPAAEPIREYFAILEALTRRIAAGVEAGIEEELREEEVDFMRSRQRFLSIIPDFYTQQQLAALNAQLDDAAGAAAGDDVVLRRIAFLRRGLEYADIYSRLYTEHRREAPDRARMHDLLQERYAFLDEVFKEDPFAIGVPWLAWREGWIASNPYGWRYPNALPDDPQPHTDDEA